ncbi:MAG: STAS domain-containing protein [Chloroflexi bacterium]|nr:MAG: STAS domain-containing protein [Chloroflexota bacterium]
MRDRARAGGDVGFNAPPESQDSAGWEGARPPRTRRCKDLRVQGTASECKGGESGSSRYRLSHDGEMDRVTLDVESRQTDTGVTVLAPSGRLDVAGAPALKEAVGEAIKNEKPRLIIDMEGVSFVDSSGLGSVVAALKQVRSSKGDLRLAAPNQQVRVVLELTTLDRVFPYYATVEEALTDF